MKKQTAPSRQRFKEQLENGELNLNELEDKVYASALTGSAYTAPAQGITQTVTKDVDQESTAIQKDDEIPDFQIGDLMTFADIQNLLNLKRSSTAERIKEAGLKPWKFGNSPTYMYLCKDVMAMFKRAED